MITPFYFQDLKISPFQFVRQGTDLTIINSPSLDNNNNIVYTTYKAYISTPNTTSLFEAFDPTNPGDILPDTSTQSGITYDLYYVVKPYYNYQFSQLNNNKPVNLLPGNFIVNSGQPNTGEAYSLISQDVFFYNQVYMDYSTVLPYTVSPSQLGVSINNTPNNVTQNNDFTVFLPQFKSYLQPTNNSGFYINVVVPIESISSKFNYSTLTSPILEYSNSSSLIKQQTTITTYIQDSNSNLLPINIVDIGGGVLVEKTTTGAFESGNIIYGNSTEEASISITLKIDYKFIPAIPVDIKYCYLYDSDNVQKRTQFPYYIKNNMETFNLSVVSQDSYIDYTNNTTIVLKPGEMYTFNPILNSINLINSFWESNLLT